MVKSRVHSTSHTFAVSSTETVADVPTQLPLGCEIGGVLLREDPRDAFVLKAGRPPCRLQDLPAGSAIGTSSIRRTAQIALRYPHLRVVDCRGNVPTRLSKLDADDGPFDGLIVAAAGLLRLDMGSRITQYLDAQNGGMMHSVGQGAIGVENRSEDLGVKGLLSSITDKRSLLACTAERSLLRTIEGGCSAPLGVETKWKRDEAGKEKLQLSAIVVSVDGKESAGVEMAWAVETAMDAEEFGVAAATAILESGADKILAVIKAKRPTTVGDLEEK